MGWLITGGVLFLLAVLPLGVRIRYDANGLLVRLLLGPVKYTVYPRPKKESKDEKKEPSRQQQEKQPEQPQETLPKPPQPPRQQPPGEKKEKGGNLREFLPLVKAALDFLGDFRRRLRLDNLYLRLILAASDPCDLAVNYGRTWAAVGSLLPVLEQCFVIQKRDVEVECDFTASETLVTARIDITITLGRLLALTAIYGIRALKEFLNLRNKRKGGAEQ